MISPYRYLTNFPFFLEGSVFRFNDVLRDTLFIFFEHFAFLPKIITEIYLYLPRFHSYLSNFFSSEVNILPSYVTGTRSFSSVGDQLGFIFQENFENFRFNRSVNPVFKYDFKVGNYLPDDNRKLNPHLFNTLKDITMGIRKSP